MKEELKELGLTDGEVSVYLALLRLGPSTNSPIARQSQLQSSSVYYCLNSLVEKGFVSYSFRGSRKVFAALNPEAIPELLSNKARQLEEQKERMHKIIPVLKAQEHSSKERTIVEIYEGHRGLQSIFNQILHELKKGESYQAFVIEQALGEEKALQLLLTRHAKELKRKGISLRLLAPEKLKKTFENMYGNMFLKKYQEMRYTKEMTPVGITIYNNNVITHVTEAGKPLSFRVRNAKLANSYKEYFDEVWKRTKPGF